MPSIDTHRLGTVEYSEESVLEFPVGLPAFDSDTRFILVERPDLAPVIFLQSLVHADLCFFAVPAECVDPSFTLRAPDEELALLGDAAPNPGDLLCLALLTFREEQPPTANMMGPVVIHRGTRRGRQIIQYDSGYSFEYPLEAQEEPC